MIGYGDPNNSKEKINQNTWPENSQKVESQVLWAFFLLYCTDGCQSYKIIQRILETVKETCI